MDLGGPQVLTNILSPEELEQTPQGVQDKLKKYLDDFFDEYCKDKAAANRLHDYELKADELQAQIQDYELKLQNYNQNVTELRSQLDTVSNERKQLLDTTSSYERELASLRNEKKAVSDERDHLLKVIERQNSEIDRLQQDLKMYQQQLKAAITAKCEALARVDEIESKDVALDFKERRMEQEREMLHKQIQNLTQDLNRNISELQNIRRENTMNSMQVEARLTEKTEELKITQVQCNQYKETIDRLTQNIQELSTKMLGQSEEAQKMMDYYKKELDAKSKLANLYKSNCEDTEVERNEMAAALADLKRMLAEASDQYGELETTFKATQLQHEQNMEEKNKSIDALKEELKHANELLKDLQDESVESAISKLAPTAALASRLIRSDMSLTELYSLYVKATEESEMQKREVARLNLQLKTILSELNENAPMVKKQEIEYEKLLETNNILAHQRDELLSKKADMEELLVDAHAKLGHMERDNKKLKHSQTDLSRQVCYLLKEVEQLRIGLTSDGANCSSSQFGNVTTTDEVISKKLVTFNNIIELQENNQKLLLLVRDLSTKLEEAETLKQEIDEASYQEKIENYASKFQSMQDTLNQQNNTVATLVSKCERYKKLYFELQKKLNKRSSHEDDLSDMEDDAMGTEENDESTINMTAQSPAGKNAKSKEYEKRIRDLEQQLQDVRDNYKTLKEQYEYYSHEKKTNEKILNEQFDSMRTEVRELTSSNCKLVSSLEYTKEQIKLQQKNIQTYKQQIQALEDRNKNYENTIVKHEQTVLYLKDEIMKSQRNQTSAESESSRLRHENRILKDTVGRLQSEKDSYNREQQSQSLLLNNLEMIKSNLERSETEGKARLEQRLDETVRELSAQRRRFQEEEDRFRETTNDLKRQSDSARKQMEEEKAQADKLRLELISLREELQSKTLQIDELSKKLQESLTPSKNDNPIVAANKKAREFEVKYEEAKIEIESLNTNLLKVKEQADQYYKMSQSAETEIKNLHELHTEYVGKAEAELKELRTSEMNLKNRISELEADLQLATVIEAPVTNNAPAEQIRKLQEELKDSLQKVSECNRNLRTLRAENITLSENLNSVESKYANEMFLHSADIQELGKVKQELVKIQSQIKELTMDRDSAKSALEDLKRSQGENITLIRKEKEEFEKRVEDLNSLNSNLHDQIDALSSKLATLSQNSTATASTANANDSVMDTSANDINRSMADAEAENKSNEQLLQIIKFLRKEKDLTVAKLDILKAENTRLSSEFGILRKKNDELQDFLNRERAKTDTNLISASKHEEILRKIETLNAVTDSNRVLREERNALTQRVKELNERIGALEDELFPLQTQNRDLNTKIDELTSENGSLRTEALRWRQRANVLVEKSNKNPEEFKRLQTERENLAKMLTAEKERIKSLSEELEGVKGEKTRLETELASLERQVHQFTEDKKSLNADVATLKQTNSRLMQEVMELKNKLLAKEETIQKATEDLESKEQLLQDSKNKEVQIRKIAKRYKDSYLELLNKAPATVANPAADAATNNTAGGQENMELAAGAANNNADGASKAELEQQRSTIESLNGVIRTMQEENEKVRKDYEDFKASVEIDERTKTLLREAKTHIVSLTESRNVVSSELATTKTKLLQNSEAHEQAMNEMKTQYQETIGRLERELMEANNRLKEDVQRLTRENESQLMRIQQLTRQLGLQQSAKPSTSSVASDKSSISDSSPRTANVKPMSGTTSGQQSATVTPWRGGETPLASIRPISVQNTRTAAILPTSQQSSSSSGTTNVVAGTSTSTSSTSSTSTPSSTPSSATGSSNTALVPPQQQVHTTGSASLETMSSSPTSSHTDYMPSTSSSASVAVAAIPPMGSASAAESSQEAESIQQPQQNEPPAHVSGGSGSQAQVVALVSPRVEGSTAPSTPSVNVQLIQDPNNPQPSTSGSSGGCSSHVAVSSHNRHTPSSSNVTTTQAGSSAGHKRPRELEGDSSTTEDDADKSSSIKHPKRMRAPMNSAEAAVLTPGVSDSGIDVDQVPTSSQRDQEDDVVVLDSEDDNMAEAEADEGGPADGDGEHEVYEDYDQDQDMDENECPEVNESNLRHDDDDGEADNNEVDVDEDLENNDGQCSSAGTVGQTADADPYATGASTSAAAAAAMAKAHSQQQDNNQQSQAISSGSGDSPQRKQANSLSRQQKATLMKLQQGAQDGEITETTETSGGARRSDSTEIVSSPQADTASSNTAQQSDELSADIDQENPDENVADEGAAEGGEFEAEDYEQKKSGEDVTSEENQKINEEEIVEGDEDFNEEDEEEAGDSIDASANVDSESHQSSGATQSEMQDIQQNQIEATSEDNEGADGVSSEGEKQAVEEVEEEGREAEASTSPSINTRSKATKGTPSNKRHHRGNFQRGGNRPTPIVWQDAPGNSRNNQPGSPGRGGFNNQRGQRARRMRRPGGGNFSNRI